ncbi:hypothetical protein FOC1_g10009033, partial [Fusarium oxysporum f. sp. cubense race 1]
NSSPELILGALKSLIKGVIAIIYKNVLLRAKINKILSRRHRAKRTKLQKGGTITIQEASQVINQIDINTQVVAESSRSSGQGRSKRPGSRRCGICSKGGYNARTY